MKKLPAILIFAIAFALVEAAVVEYLRSIYYPSNQGGFAFPLRTLDQINALGPEHYTRLLIELAREAATLIMLAAVGFVAGRNSREAWAHFMLTFGLWDVFFYLWLKILLDWPSSMLEWDLLFLIPVPWVAPVIAPVFISLLLIGAGMTVLIFEEKSRPILPKCYDWLIFITGGIMVIVSFCWDYKNIISGGIPNPFNWSLFILGTLTALTNFIRITLRTAAAE